MKIEQEVLTTACRCHCRAEDVLLCLSGMIEAVRPDTDITEVAKNNTLTDDDFLRESLRRRAELCPQTGA